MDGLKTSIVIEVIASIFDTINAEWGSTKPPVSSSKYRTRYKLTYVCLGVGTPVQDKSTDREPMLLASSDKVKSNGSGKDQKLNKVPSIKYIWF